MSYITPLELKCAELSQKIYGNANDLVQNKVFDSVVVNGSAQTGLLELGNRLYVVHQGTNDLKDWLKNIDTGNRYTPAGVKSREGFYLHARATWRGVRNIIADSKASHIVFTGHSLGGITSTIQAQLSFEMFSQYQNTMSIVTFGAPRGLGASGATRVSENLEGKISRFVSKGDLVPSMPLSLFWRHTDGLAYISNGNIHRQSIKPIRSSFRSAGNFVRGVFSFAKQHNMSLYESKLKKHQIYNVPEPLSPTDGYEVVSA